MVPLEKALVALALNGLADGLLDETAPCDALETAGALRELAAALEVIAGQGSAEERLEALANDPIWGPS